MLDKDQLYADWLLTRWGAWVRTEQIRLDGSRGGPSGPPVIDDEQGVCIDQAIARTAPSTRHVIKRLYFRQDISVPEVLLAPHLTAFMREFYAEQPPETSASPAKPSHTTNAERFYALVHRTRLFWVYAPVQEMVYINTSKDVRKSYVLMKNVSPVELQLMGEHPVPDDVIGHLRKALQASCTQGHWYQFNRQVQNALALVQREGLAAMLDYLECRLN